MDNCIFCKIIRGEAPSWKVMETPNAMAFLDINPISKYHTLVVPKSHACDIFEISEESLSETILLVRKVCRLYKEKLGIENIQIINNNGREAQQDVFHIHYHIIPRSKDDGQSIKWKSHSYLRESFDDMMKKLNV